MAFTTEQHRIYQKQRRLERLALAKERLGGKCAVCSSTEDLQFDHVIPGSKARKISEATNWSMERFLAEVDKCQLLCFGCHIRKSQESGELNGSCKLSVDDVMNIRASSLTSAEMSVMFDVTRNTIRRIKKRDAWRFLP